MVFSREFLICLQRAVQKGSPAEFRLLVLYLIDARLPTEVFTNENIINSITKKAWEAIPMQFASLGHCFGMNTFQVNTARITD